MRILMAMLICAPTLFGARTYASPPTGFMENRGQVIDQDGRPHATVRYLLHRPGLNLQLRERGFSYDVYAVEHDELPPSFPHAPLDRKAQHGQVRFLTHRIDVTWNGTGPPRIEAEEPFSDRFGFVGPNAHVAGVLHYERIRYRDISPGIDLVFQLDDRGMPKYDVVVRPEGDISSLRFQYSGADGIMLKEGALLLGTRHGPFVERIPVSHLLGGPEVDCRFVLHDDGTVGFDTPLLPRGSTLVIDPWLGWGTYMGGAEWDACLALATDANSLYLSGESRSPIALATSGAHQNDLLGTMDAFVARFTPDGERIWCTYLGGSGEESAHGLAVDDGLVHIGGHGTSNDLSGSTGTHQPMPAGGGDAFLATFTTEGQFVWLTWFGGAQEDGINGVAAKRGRVHVVGWTRSTSGIATSGAAQASFGGAEDALLASFRTDGTLIHATYQGGSNLERGNAIAVEGQRIVTTGWTGSASGMSSGTVHQGFFGGTLDAYLACHDTTGALLWTTYYGGGLAEHGHAVTLHDGLIHLGGATESGQYISTPGVHQEQHGGGGWDGFIARFTVDGQRIWGTYYGGYDTDLVHALAVEGDGVYATGISSSVLVMGGMPCHQPYFMGGYGDAFVAHFGPQGERRWGTYYGGYLGDQGMGIAALGTAVYVGGYTGSTSLVSTPGVYQTEIGGNVDVLLARFSGGLVGIDEGSMGTATIGLHPNPAQEQVMVHWDRPGTSAMQWQLLDATGALVRGGPAPDGGPWRMALDVSDLVPGIYMLRLSGQGADQVGRLVVLR
jgi:hypothetical protein